MNVTLVISSLSSGGAERVMTIMANYWAEKGWNITLITLSGTESDFYPLASRVNRIGLNLLKPSTNILHSFRNNLRRIVLLRRVIQKSKSQVVISFMDRMNVVTLLATRGINIPVIISERIDPSQYFIGRWWVHLRKWLYPMAALLVVLTESVKKWGKHKWPLLKVDIIQNPVFIVSDTTEFKTPFSPGNWIVAMGRFSDQKGFDLLLQAFNKAKYEVHAEWHLAILGEGPQRDELTAMAKSLGLEKNVRMPGLVKQPEKYLQSADLFVLSSRYEGFPNALLEAMACGLPVISFDCHSGPREIIRDGVDGILVPPVDVNALAKAMRGLMTSSEERQRLGENALAVKERFGIKKIMGQWEALIGRLVRI